MGTVSKSLTDHCDPLTLEGGSLLPGMIRSAMGAIIDIHTSSGGFSNEEDPP